MIIAERWCIKMKATLKLEDGWEITVDVNEETLKQIEKPVKKTGYGRVAKGDTFYYSYASGVGKGRDSYKTVDDALYKTASYYSDKTVAEHNARADTLMRKLRRFAVEHRKRELDWWNNSQSKYEIYYYYKDKEIKVAEYIAYRDFGNIYFDTIETAKAAIEEFKDELIWYFTEYKDSL